jgi:hypothetical protein
MLLLLHPKILLAIHCTNYEQCYNAQILCFITHLPFSPIDSLGEVSLRTETGVSGRDKGGERVNPSNGAGESRSPL